MCVIGNRSECRSCPACSGLGRRVSAWNSTRFSFLPGDHVNQDEERGSRRGDGLSNGLRTEYEAWEGAEDILVAMGSDIVDHDVKAEGVS